MSSLLFFFDFFFSGLTCQLTVVPSCRDGTTTSWVLPVLSGVKCLSQGHKMAEVGPPAQESYTLNFHFDFLGGTLDVIASVPGHCLLFNFYFALSV